VRVGVLSEGGRYRTDNASNYLGTYLFTSLAAYQAGRPALYTLRVGDPLVEYWNVRTGFYAQDDIRVSKSLSLSPGIRYETQTHVPTLGHVGPRIGITWAPLKSGRATLRASYGVFYQWLSNANYEQTSRVDGVHQKDVTVVNPTYPAVSLVGTGAATNRFLLGDDLHLARTRRFSTGFDQTLTKQLKLSMTFSDTRIAGILRGQNLNTPVAGVRPDSAFANVIETVSDAQQRTQQLATTLTLNFAVGARPAPQGRVNWRRQTLRLSYWLAKAENNSDGAFAVPPSGTLATEWAPTNGDQRHRISMALSTQALKNLNATLTLAANTGTPYTITTGLDDNGDLLFNDRPVGVGRSSARIASPYTLALNASYLIALRAAASGSAKYRLSLTANVTNLTNHANYTGYSGAMTSPFFRQATAVSSVRRVDFGMSLAF
jgi:hypothetical protein